MTEGWRGNDGLFTLTLTLSHQGRGDVPGPACAGMTGGWRGNDGGFTLTLGPPLNLPLGGGGRWLEGEGMYPVPPLWVPASAGMTERGWFKENAPVSPRGRFPILSYVL